jgi:hypothetical protein
MNSAQMHMQHPFLKVSHGTGGKPAKTSGWLVEAVRRLFVPVGRHAIHPSARPAPMDASCRSASAPAVAESLG